MGRKNYLYKLDIDFPEGAMDPTGRPAVGWRPEGWTAEDETYARFVKDDVFHWPYQRVYRSYNGAFNRAELFRKYGCTVDILQSKPVEWDVAVAEVKRRPINPEPAIKGLVRILRETDEQT